MSRLLRHAPAMLAFLCCATCNARVEVERAAARMVEYEVDPTWPTTPAGRALGQVSGVAVDARGRVYVFHRAGAAFDNEDVIAAPTVRVLDGERGDIVAEWGGGLFATPHGISIDANDHVWLTDSTLDRVVEATTAGEVIHVYQGR